MDETSRKAHWETVYTTKAENEVSWFQDDPAPSIELIDRASLAKEAHVIDIGGGASRLVDRLVARGFANVAVLDISAASLDLARARLRANGETVQWIVADVTAWQPVRRFDLWHDRAAFHFLVDAAERAAYIDCLKRALVPGGHAIIASFAVDGPEKCSGLPVERYDPAGLAAQLGEAFRLIESRRHDHRTPWHTSQWFQFSLFQMQHR